MLPIRCSSLSYFLGKRLVQEESDQWDNNCWRKCQHHAYCFCSLVASAAGWACLGCYGQVLFLCQHGLFEFSGYVSTGSGLNSSLTWQTIIPISQSVVVANSVQTTMRLVFSRAKTAGARTWLPMTIPMSILRNAMTAARGTPMIRVEMSPRGCLGIS